SASVGGIGSLLFEGGESGPQIRQRLIERLPLGIANLVVPAHVDLHGGEMGVAGRARRLDDRAEARVLLLEVFRYSRKRRMWNQMYARLWVDDRLQLRHPRAEGGDLLVLDFHVVRHR